MDECLPGLNREGMTDGAQLPQLEEAATDDATDVIGRDAGTMGTRGAAAPLPFWEGSKGGRSAFPLKI